ERKWNGAIRTRFSQRGWSLHRQPRRGAVRESVKPLALALLRDELVEKSHHLVAPGNQRFDLVLGQIRLRCVKHLVVTELSKLGEHLAVALDEVFWVLQVVLKPEGPTEINPPNLPILRDEH